MQIFGGGARFLTEKDMANTNVGTNLYQGTKDFSGTNWVFNGTHSQINSFRAIKNAYQDFTALEVNAAWNGARQDILANFGETYTFSGFIKKGSGNPDVVFFGNAQGVANIGHVDSDGKPINITDGWSRFSITFTVTTGGIVQPRIESSNGGPDTTYFIAGLKLERGAVATQWCPAPEDYAHTLLKCVPHVNLLKNSAGPFYPQANPNAGNNGQTDVNAIDQWQIFSNSTVTLVKGETYTLSATTNGVFSNVHDPSKASNKCVIWIGAPANVILSGENVSANTFTWDSDTGTYSIRVNRYGVDSTVKCWNLKIEHGSQATDWTPCPLDS